MTFASITYVCFLPAVVCGYYLLPRPLRGPFLLVASYAFYVVGHVEYGLLMAAATLVSWCAGLGIAGAAGPRARRCWLAVSLLGNLGLLAVFKYLGFFAANIAVVVPGSTDVSAVSALQLVLPVGISFYTFQAVGYTLDVYRGAAPERRLHRYALFLAFFPQLVAGPIERTRQLLPQLPGRDRVSAQDVSAALVRISWGLFKKLVVADRLGTFVDPVYAEPHNHSAWTLLLATYMFIWQLYCDFSAYTDIAVGSAALFGVRLMENFRQPFAARSVGEFWQRWHISLTTWFRDYVYLPVARRRRRRLPHALDVFLLFVLVGLWHGASWTFVLFGVAQAVFIVSAQLSRRWRGTLRRRTGLNAWPRLLTALQVVTTFHLLVASVVLFRAESVQDAHVVYRRILSVQGPWRDSLPGPGTYELGLAVLGVVVVLVSEAWAARGARRPNDVAAPVTRNLLLCYVLWITTIALGVFGRNEFLYFRF